MLLNRCFLLFLWQMAIMPMAICQFGFGKIVGIEPALNLNLDDIIYHNNQLIVRGNAYLISDSIWSLFVAGLDTNGTLLWYNTIIDSTKNSHIVTNTPSRFTTADNTDLIIPSYYFNFGDIVLFITDSFGMEKLRVQYINNEKTIFPQDVLFLDDYIYIFGTHQRENFNTDVFLIKADTLGHLIWMKYYGDESYHEDFGGKYYYEDGTITISSCRYVEEFINPVMLSGWLRPWFFTIDTSGEIINSWFGDYFDERTWGCGPLTRTSNGDLIAVGTDYKTVPFHTVTEVNSSPTITRLDSNFNQIWKLNLTDFTGRYDRLWDLEHDPIRNEYVAAGFLEVWYDDDYSESEIWVIKFNPDGDVIWNITDTIVYNRQEIHYTAGLDIAPSGSIYVAGNLELYQNQPDYGFILKVTPDGCSDTICTTVSLKDQILLKQAKILVYPNPVREELYIEVDEFKEGFRFSLYDVLGQQILSQPLDSKKTNIHIDGGSGMYFYTVRLYGKILDSGKLVIN